MDESPLDWKADLLHPRNQRFYSDLVAARYADDPIDAGETTASVMAQIAQAEVWDLDPALLPDLATVAKTIPYTDILAADMIPAPTGLLRLPPRKMHRETDHDPRTVSHAVGLQWGPTAWPANGGGWRLFLAIRRLVRVSLIDKPSRHITAPETLTSWPVESEPFARMCGIDGAGFENDSARRLYDFISDGHERVVFSDGTETIVGSSAEEQWVGHPGCAMLRLLLATWTMARSEVLDAARTRQDRPAVKRSRRAGSTCDTVVRVTLPGRRTGSTPGTGEGAGIRAHWCRGHWRWQPVGPGRAERRLTWVRPHVRGTVGDTPALGEKVVTVR